MKIILHNSGGHFNTFKNKAFCHYKIYTNATDGLSLAIGKLAKIVQYIVFD